MYFLGYDIGSSFIKASLIDGATGGLVASASAPGTEMKIAAPKVGWAEQDPETWWNNVKDVTGKLLSGISVNPKDIKAIGISYQMHGLVVVDKNQRVLRPSIIWCDSRATEIGEKAFKKIGQKKSLKHFLNSPGNFTASKLKWVKENEPGLYEKIDKIMLPGDYIAMKLSGEAQTTISGLSEGVFWDYKKQDIADLLLDFYGISKELLSAIVPTFGEQAELSSEAAKELGLKAGTKITYRSGDQPNNAFSLNCLNPGELAATAGTSGVVYGVTDQTEFDERSRVNTFVHINHTDKKPRYGILLCVNGTGSLNNWLKQLLNVSGNISYQQMNDLAAGAPAGSDGLLFYPFGNGAERILEDRNIGASLHGLQFNRHSSSHVLRAAQEGTVFALNYGLEIMRGMGVKAKVVRAGEANMFLSPLFRETFASLTGTVVELYNTDGSQGAARGAGVGMGYYKNYKEAFHGLKKIQTIEPDKQLAKTYKEAYGNWLMQLNKFLKKG